MRSPDHLEDRLVRFIQPAENGCWLWNGPTHRGYPVLKIDGEKRCVRPLMYEMQNGTRPKSEMVARPQIKMSCGVQACVNPDHMLVATDQERLLTRLKQEVYMEGKAKAGTNSRFRFMTTPAYVSKEAQQRLELQMVVRNPTPEVQDLLAQIRNRTFTCPPEGDSGEIT